MTSIDNLNNFYKSLVEWIYEKQKMYCPSTSYDAFSTTELIHYPLTDGLLDINISLNNNYSKVYSINSTINDKLIKTLMLLKSTNSANKINIINSTLDNFLLVKQQLIHKTIIIVELNDTEYCNIDDYVKLILEDIGSPLLILMMKGTNVIKINDKYGVDKYDTEKYQILCIRKQRILKCLPKHQQQINKLMEDSSTKKMLIKFLYEKLKQNKEMFLEVENFLLTQKNTSDKKIYNKIHSIIYKNNITESSNDTSEKSRYIADQIMKFLQGKLRTKIISYLDIGCAEGSLTVEIGKRLKLSKYHIHGCDIRDIKKTANFNFRLIKNDKLPYENNSMSVISVIMVLHHVKELKKMLSEIYRVLQPGGYLLIKEHDSTSEQFSNFIDVVHGLYSLSLSHPVEDPTFCENYYASYKAENEWRNIITSVGFDKTFYSSFPKKKYSIQQWFYSLFKKRTY